VKITKINDYIYFFYGLRSSNIYYFDCDKKAIIDTGYGEESDLIYNTFLNSGINLNKIDYIINTHSHGDHNGLNSYIKKNNPRVKIFSSNKTDEYQSLRDKYKFFLDSEDSFGNYDIDIQLNNNDIIDLGNSNLKVIETKGHTIDSISLYLKNENILFSGDTVYNRIIPQLDYYQDFDLSLKELEESYNKIISLNPKIIFTGHGDSITNPNENLNYCLKKLKRFEKDRELILVNNLIPSIQFYLSNKQINDKELVIQTFFDNLVKIKKNLKIDESRYEKVIEKSLSLMKMLNIIKIDNNKIYLTTKLNEYFATTR